MAATRPSMVGLREKPDWSASMARPAATSPPACPPMPSATANRVMLSRDRSSLTVRTRPTSVAEPDRRTVTAWPGGRSSGHLEHGAAHLQEIAAPQSGGAVDLLGVHPGAVGGPEIFHPDGTVAAKDPGVEVRGVGVLHVDGAARGPTDGDLVRQVVGLAPVVLGLEH